MVYDTILARSFSRYEQKRLGYGAFAVCLLIILSIYTVFKPYLGPIHDLNLKLSVGVGIKMFMVSETSSSQQIAKVEGVVTKILVNETNTSPQMVQVKQMITNKVEPLCTSEERTDFCETNGDIRVQGNSSYVYIVSNETSIIAENMSWRIRPYARRGDGFAMSHVREWSLMAVKSSQNVPQCTRNHSIPAVLFSLSGYAGNHFHDFTDIIIPLFLTSRQFNGEVQFLITDKHSWWIAKYHGILNELSNYEPIDIDRDDGIHCFPSVIVGLKRYHRRELSIDPQKHFYSMKDFRDFLGSAYSLNKVKAIRIRNGQHKKPKLLVLTRKRTRTFTNRGEIVKLAKSLGFKVVAMEANGNISRFAGIVNSCDVLMGVHGAGLTNIVFLPDNAIFIQIVPYGGIEWLATNDFGEPSRDMNLNYFEYKIRLEESTLIQQYPLDRFIIKEPFAVQKAGWEAFRSVYLDKQNVMLDVNRFRPTLLKALELLHQ
ncbi:hypothetical protein L6164_008058 [Bauhinia variegata]|uniref:Uncharacterized protein n=1 Tax=Bauhinia variegata TaxID=167791 RepID=A0ACB9PFU8_BAUVA|nr:hypothetical protein L6164_008058 [Bauhinia variegata]